jgi:hypothetical protein
MTAPGKSHRCAAYVRSNKASCRNVLSLFNCSLAATGSSDNGLTGASCRPNSYAALPVANGKDLAKSSNRKVIGVATFGSALYTDLIAYPTLSQDR